jgi:hypothetical protein
MNGRFEISDVKVVENPSGLCLVAKVRGPDGQLRQVSISNVSVDGPDHIPSVEKNQQSFVDTYIQIRKQEDIINKRSDAISNMNGIVERICKVHQFPQVDGFGD